MHIICMTPLAEGVYNDHKADHITSPPEGWAYIPEDFPLPSTFPCLGSIKAEKLTYTRTVKTMGEDGKTTDKGRVYTMLTVTAMTEGTLPDPVPELPTQLDRVEAQVTYTAMMTDTLLEV